MFIALLAADIAVIVIAEWPRMSSFLGRDARSGRQRGRRKTQLRIVHSEEDEFAASVQRDLDRLPTIEEHEHR